MTYLTSWRLQWLIQLCLNMFGRTRLLRCSELYNWTLSRTGDDHDLQTQDLLKIFILSGLFMTNITGTAQSSSCQRICLRKLSWTNKLWRRWLDLASTSAGLSGGRAHRSRSLAPWPGWSWRSCWLVTGSTGLTWRMRRWPRCGGTWPHRVWRWTTSWSERPGTQCSEGTLHMIMSKLSPTFDNDSLNRNSSNTII